MTVPLRLSYVGASALAMLMVTAASSRELALAEGVSQHGKPAQTTSADPSARCAVWARELGFAQTVIDHDASAFAGFVHASAVFGVGGDRPQRGREAIVTGWQRLIDGTALELRWYPEAVSIAGDGRTAYSSGPALYRSKKDGSTRLGRFGSVWQIDSDGQWRVIFDDGISPVPIDEAGVKAFEAGRRAECPAA